MRGMNKYLRNFGGKESVIACISSLRVFPHGKENMSDLTTKTKHHFKPLQMMLNKNPALQKHPKAS